MNPNHFRCSICGKIYVSRATLDMHNRWHKPKNTIPLLIQNNGNRNNNTNNITSSNSANSNYNTKNNCITSGNNFKNNTSNNCISNNCISNNNIDNILSNYAIHASVNPSVGIIVKTLPQNSANNNNNNNNNSNNIIDNSCVSAFSQYPNRPLKALPSISDVDTYSSKQFQSMTLPELVLISNSNSNMSNNNINSKNSNNSSSSNNNNSNSNNNNNTSNTHNNKFESEQEEQIKVNIDKSSSSFSYLLPSAPLPLLAKLNPYGFRQPDHDATQSTLSDVSKLVEVPTSSAVHLNGNSKSAPNQVEIPYNSIRSLSSQPLKPIMPTLIPIVRNVPPLNKATVIF